jgi:hypothetical protein
MCHFSPTGAMKSLVRGAALEWIALGSSREEENESCIMKLSGITQLSLGEATILATPAGVAYDPEFELHGIPATLPLGIREFELIGPEGVAGVAAIEVVDEVKADTKIVVDYRLRASADPEISSFQSYFDVASGVADDATAVVNPMVRAGSEADTKVRYLVANTTKLSIPAKFYSGALEAWNPIPRENTWGRPTPVPIDSTWDEFVWAVEYNPTVNEVYYHHAERLFREEPRNTSTDNKGKPGEALPPKGESKESQVGSLNAPAVIPPPGTPAADDKTKAAEAKMAWPWRVLLDGPSSITFDVLRTTEREIRPRLGFFRVRWGRPVDAPTKDPKYKPSTEPVFMGYQKLLEVDVTLAARARRESIPLPIRDLLEVQCDTNAFGDAQNTTDIAWNGTTKAIENEALRSGQCTIGVRADKLRLLKKVVSLFGPQTLVVSVQREGVDKAERVWPLRIESDGNSQNDVLILPTPSGDNDAKGLYRVEVRIAAQVTGDAVYRGATKDKILDELRSREQTDLRFTANLRPRGPFGWRAPIRTYVTAFIPLSGFRTPAAPTELRNSQQLTSVQYVTPRAGLLFTLEPFNADKGVNPWPMNPGLQAGINIVNIAEGEFAPTFLFGGALSLPVLEGSVSQLGSKVTLGAYYEYDPRVDFKYANHFLLTLGLNIGSLFSGNTK